MDDVNGQEASLGAVLDSSQRTFLTQIAQDIRTTASNLKLPKVSPLSVVDANAVSAIKDLFYMINSEDPHNTMPARCFVFEQDIIKRSLIPILTAIDKDPASQTNQKRWSVPMYQTLRALSVLSAPISSQNDILTEGATLDSYLIQLNADLAESRPALTGFVSLLQYYIERKAEKQTSLAPAEESKLEDARIDNILRFFRNLLTPPRKCAAPDVRVRDKGVHLALVGSLVAADLYPTINILFSSCEDSAGQFTDLVFLVSDIYAQTYRYTCPQEMYRTYRKHFPSYQKAKIEDKKEQKTKEDNASKEMPSVFDEPDRIQTSKPKLPVQRDILKKSRSSSAVTGLRAAIQRERSTIGGTRAFALSARWTSRHSGGVTQKKKPSSDQNNARNSTSNESSSNQVQNDSHDPPSQGGSSRLKRIISAQAAIQSTLSFNPRRPLQDRVKFNSDVLCMTASKGRMSVFKVEKTKQNASNSTRRDLQLDGLKGLVSLTMELIDDCFGRFLSELRHRIQDVKERASFDECEMLKSANNSFLTIVAAVVGFQRERFGKIFKNSSEEPRPLNAAIHENTMKAVLSSDFKVVKSEWSVVRSAIELESFQLVFSILVDSFENIKKNGKSDADICMVELATSAILQMMKLLQGMATVDENVRKQEKDLFPGKEDNSSKPSELTPREIALNTLEQLFEREAFLNASADLAREYSPRVFSFTHLTNVVEVAHAFTTILLDEQEFSKLQVNKKKRTKPKRKIRDDPDEEEKDPDYKATNNDPKQTSEENPSSHGSDQPKPDGNENERPTTEENGTNQIDGDNKEFMKQDEDGVTNTQRNSQKPSVKDLIKADVDAERQRLKQKSILKKKKDSTITPVSNDGDNEQEVTELADEDPDAISSEDDLPELREVESVGIVRRFANFRAIESLVLPIRASLCDASALSGQAYPIPDGGSQLLHPVIVAKSAHVLASVWRVAKINDRGIHCGQFFSYSFMQLIDLVQACMEQNKVLNNSVLERFSVFGKDVTSVFFKWLSVNPAFPLDIFFNMDRMSCHMYISYMRDKNEMLRREKDDDGSGTESDLSIVNQQASSQPERELKKSRSRKSSAKDRKISQLRKDSMRERRRAERDRIEDDEDVDDIDNLDIGVEDPNASENEYPEDDKAKETTPEDNINDGKQSKKDRKKKKQQVEIVTNDSDSDSSIDNIPLANLTPNKKVSEKVPTQFSRLASSKRRRKQIFDPFASDDELLERVKERRRPKKQKKAKKVEKPKDAPKMSQKDFSSSDEYSEAELLLARAEANDSDNDIGEMKPLSSVAREVHERLKKYSDGDESDDDSVLKTTPVTTDGDRNLGATHSDNSNSISNGDKDEPKESEVGRKLSDVKVTTDKDSEKDTESNAELTRMKQRRKIVLSDDESE